MIDWEPTKLGEEIELAYGKSLPSQLRKPGPYNVFGSNGAVGTNSEALVQGPGIIVGRKGSVGKLAFSAEPFWPIDTTYYVVNRKGHDWRFLYHLLRAQGLDQLNSHSAVPGLNREDVYTIEVSIPDFEEQKLIGALLDVVEMTIDLEEQAISEMTRLRGAVSSQLFARGLRGEIQKDTEIGRVPESWHVDRLDRYADVISTRMSYTELEQLETTNDDNQVKVLGIKVGDMNRPGNEKGLYHAELEKLVSRAVAEHQCAPPQTIIFPKRGAAIATNKKRLSHEWTAFDPNVIGVVSQDKLDQEYLFHWFQRFDLRTITEPGPTPQLNKKNLEPVIIPIPPTLEEQQEIVTILEAIDDKNDLHKCKRAVADDLFNALLHMLMSGEIRVADLDLATLDQARLAEAAA